MVEQNNDSLELAVLMQLQPIKIEEAYKLEFIPTKVIIGTFHEDADIFIEDNGQTYMHLSYSILYKDLCKYNTIKYYALRKNLNKLKEKHPNLSLNEIKYYYLNEISKYKYYIGYISEENDYTIIIQNNENNKLILFDDKDMASYHFLKEKFKQIYNSNETIENNKEVKEIKKYLFNAHELSSKIKQNVFGQDEAIDKIIQTLWCHYYFIDEEEEYNKENILVIGQSGVGKTEIFRQINKFLPDITVHIADLSSITETGIVGDSITNIIYDLIIKCIEEKNGIQYVNTEKIEHSILVLDEFDKIAIKNQNGVDVGGRPVQEELLKIIEGKELSFKLKINDTIENVVINTSKIIFACCGAFNGITKNIEKNIGFGKDISKNNSERKYQEINETDLNKYGFIQEITGRIPVIVTLNELNLETLIKIVKDSKKSLFIKKLKLLKKLVKEVTIDENLYEEVAREAINKKIGARGLDNVSSTLFYPILNEIINSQDEEVSYEYASLNKETVINPKNYTLIRKKKD